MATLWVYVGTSENKPGKGIYRFPFDPTTGEAGSVELASEAARPTFLALHPHRPLLYAVNAIGEFQGQKTGAVSAFALEATTGELRLLNQQPSGGAGPCHVIVDREGRNVLVANYAGGSLACLPLDAEGRLKAPSCVIQHAGSSVNPRRQEGPHAHSINLDAAATRSAGTRFAFVADLGLDKLFIYRFDAAHGMLTPHDPPSVSTAPGAGPRHFAFHPSGGFAYLINELDSTVIAFTYDSAAGVLRQIQTITTLPDDFSGENFPAEVLAHPSGRFLYGSNRGHDSLAIYSIDGQTGRLTPVGHQPSGGKGPRNFNFDPSGAWMIVGNQSSNNILVLRIDLERGTLTPTGQELAAPSPICFKMVPAAE